MKCPKCDGEMIVTGLDRIEIDRCSECHGLWFQPWELDELKFDQYRAPFALDTGSARVGRKHDKIENPKCPECGVVMEQQRDPEQKHILFDVCPEGHGVYLDAGEFTDLARKTLWDRFKRAR